MGLENGEDMTSHHVDASRPALGFPLGTALLLIVIFCLSGFFSCCYHWDKLRSLRRRAFSADDDDDDDTDAIHPSAPPKSTSAHLKEEKLERQSLPVIMPGDEIPKYMGWPCPMTDSKKMITIEVQTQSAHPSSS